MSDLHDAPPRSRGGLWWFVALLVLVALVAAGVWWWRAQQAHALAERSETQQQLQALTGRVDALRSGQRAQASRLQEAAATNRVLRDELLGLTQRSALLEDSVSKLADSTRQGAQALRLDEAELMLTLGQQRLSVAGDVIGAQHAYALAARVLDGVDDPRLLNVRQALQQERGALDGLRGGPRQQLGQQLDAIASALTRLPLQAPAAQADAVPVWQRLLAPLVQIRPATGNATLQPANRAAARAALDLELSLARTALERGDTEGFRGALQRAGQWLPRLWLDSPQRADIERALSALARQSVKVDIPLLGSTLEQLHLLRGGQGAPLSSPASPEARP
jgi:uroporphyrin-3 C-methyltransferase